LGLFEMAVKISSIVEGHGEVAALPVLLRRLATWLTPEVYFEVAPPIRVNKDRFLNKDEEFRRHVLLAAGKVGQSGWVLVLLDADDDCPAVTGAEILERAKKIVPGLKISVVLANREYEAWFIAAAKSLDGFRGFSLRGGDVVEAERPRDAKGWIGDRMPAGYGEVLDQPAFSARFDLEQALEGSRSFRKLHSEWGKQAENFAE